MHPAGRGVPLAPAGPEPLRRGSDRAETVLLGPLIAAFAAGARSPLTAGNLTHSISVREQHAQAAPGTSGARPASSPAWLSPDALLRVLRAVVTSLGITHTVLPWLCATCGSACTYW
jgi:hypothetical protein